MRYRYFLIILFMLVMLAQHCGGSSEPITYTHEIAGFKITIPAGWVKTLEDNEMYEFRSGDYKLIEVGGFDLGLTSGQLHGITEAEVADWIEESTLEGSEGYCDEARIVGYTIQHEGSMTWAGLPAYEVQIRGYSEEAEEIMIVDIITGMYTKNGYMYMFASQIAENLYEDVKTELDASIKSFQLVW